MWRLSLAVRHLSKFGAFKKSPLGDSVAAVSVGIVNGEPLLDLNYEEDSRADVDMNIVMTGGGKFIEVQGTAEHAPFDESQMSQLIALAQAGHRRVGRVTEEGDWRVKLWCATGNAGKLREFRRAAAEAGIEIDGLPDFRRDSRVRGRRRHFRRERHSQSASLRAVRARTGLCRRFRAWWSTRSTARPASTPRALPGRTPPMKTTTGSCSSDCAASSNRSARFVCVIALVERGEVRGLYEGAVEGEMLDAPRGPGGFGYDPLFYYPPFGAPLAKLPKSRSWRLAIAARRFGRCWKPSGSPAHRLVLLN